MHPPCIGTWTTSPPQRGSCTYLIQHNTVQTSYGVEDAEYAVVMLAQTTMRSELGKIKLDSVFQERENLNHMIVGEYTV